MKTVAVIRSFSSVVCRNVTGHPPLNEPFLGISCSSKIQYDDILPKDTKITELSNGLKVATAHRSGSMCSIGVVLGTGPRHEGKFRNGVSHFLEKLSFASTKEYDSSDHMVEALQPYGGMYEAQQFRDVSVFSVSCFKHGLDMATNILAQTLFHAKLTEEEVEEARHSIAYELETYSMTADQEPIVTDLVHAAAYNNNTVGLRKICPVSNLASITRSDIMSFYQSHYVPSRMVLVGVGVPHEDLVNAAQKYFPSVHNHGECDMSTAVYTGGHCYMYDDSAPPVIGPQELPTLTHVSIGFKSSSHQDEDYVKYCVFNTLMGGGGSFSAGGPGKGMYTRLYLQVLNRYHWMYSALAFNHVYQDTGMFTIHGSSHPSHGWDLVQVLIKQFKEMSSNIDHSELQRAKTQLKSTLLMNLEYRNIELEDIGRQVLASNERKSAQELCSMIDSVTPLQLNNIARSMLESPPAVGAFGDLKHVPSYQEISAAFKRDNGELQGRLSQYLLRGVRGKQGSNIQNT